MLLNVLTVTGLVGLWWTMAVQRVKPVNASGATNTRPCLMPHKGVQMNKKELIAALDEFQDDETVILMISGGGPGEIKSLGKTGDCIVITGEYFPVFSGDKGGEG